MRCKKCGYKNIAFMKDSEKGWKADNLIWHKLLIPDLMIIGFLIMLLVLSWAYKQDLNTFEEQINACNEKLQNSIISVPIATNEPTGLNWPITPTTSGEV